MDNASDVGRICTAIALCCDMERCISVLGITLEEELEERIYVLGCDRACIDSGAVIGV